MTMVAITKMPVRMYEVALSNRMTFRYFGTFQPFSRSQ